MKRKIFLAFFLLLIGSSITYLPLVGQLGYLNDDWYLMYTAKAYGSEVFIDIFNVDRPARALVMIPAYGLFGENPLYYNLSAYMFRLISGFAFLWTLRMLFPRQKRATSLAALLFLIYPGFLSQPNGVDYQSHFIGLATAHLSITLTIKAVLANRFVSKFGWHSLAVLFGFLYLSQMEWYIGFEIFRWGSVFLISFRADGRFIQKIWHTIRSAFPALLVPLIFLVWRIFFFQSERGATDVNAQFEQIKLYPIQTLYHWAIQVSQDLIDVLIAAWYIPLSQLPSHIEPWGGVLAIILAGITLYVFHHYEVDTGQKASASIFTREALVLGMFIAIGGLLPIAMVNRDVSFPAYSRYSLVSSAGVAVLFSAALTMIRQRMLRNGLISLLVLLSVLTHHANTVKAVRQTAATNNFWWQVSWRIPQLEKNTTLIANYPNAIIEEDYFVWGPANMIYFPEKQNANDIQPGVFAVLLNRTTVEKVIARERQEYDKRKNIITYANYRNILVMTQPSVNSCVHVINGMQSEYSPGEWDLIREVGPYSEIEHILVNETPHTPPTVVFGPEPAHGWCYYYQKADLARQRGEWEKVLEIGSQAFGQGFEPVDLIEWMPFLQAYALNGDVEHLRELSPVVNAVPYISEQVCQILRTTPGLSNIVIKNINSLFCAK